MRESVVSLFQVHTLGQAFLQPPLRTPGLGSNNLLRRGGGTAKRACHPPAAAPLNRSVSLGAALAGP